MLLPWHCLSFFPSNVPSFLVVVKEINNRVLNQNINGDEYDDDDDGDGNTVQSPRNHSSTLEVQLTTAYAHTHIHGIFYEFILIAND